MGHTWFYSLILVVYVSSILFYFIDFLQYNRKANRMAFWLLFLVWMLQSVYFISQTVIHRTLPLFSQFDTLFLYAWLIITLSLLTNWFFRMDFFLFFTNIVGFSVMSFTLFAVGRGAPDPFAQAFLSEWIAIHIVIAFISYAAFTLSFVCSGLYLFQHDRLKKKKWSQRFRRWPGLVQLETYAYYLNLLGMPLLLLSLILGLIWAYVTLPFPFWLDTKVIFSLFALLMYGLYLYQRVVKGWSGKRIVELNLICFGVLVVNYLISNILPTFHG